jgi:hypothetical protein
MAEQQQTGGKPRQRTSTPSHGYARRPQFVSECERASPFSRDQKRAQEESPHEVFDLFSQKRERNARERMGAGHVGSHSTGSRKAKGEFRLSMLRSTKGAKKKGKLFSRARVSRTFFPFFSFCGENSARSSELFLLRHGISAKRLLRFEQGPTSC